MYPYFVQTLLLFSPPDFCISIKKPGCLLCQWILSLINHTFYGKRGLILYDSVSAASQKLPHLKILNWQSSHIPFCSGNGPETPFPAQGFFLQFMFMPKRLLFDHQLQIFLHLFQEIRFSHIQVTSCRAVEIAVIPAFFA